MQCPSCKTVTLAMTERQGIEIDYCPECRGVWLDRGELDRLVERTGATPAPTRHAAQESHGYGNKPRKPKSLLGELFDF